MFNEKWRTGVKLFGFTHDFMLIIFIASAIAVVLNRDYFIHNKRADKIFRYGMCAFAVVFEIIFTVWSIVMMKDIYSALPFELCSITLWLTVIAAVFKKERLGRVTFFFSVTGSLLALIVVQVQYRPPHFRFFHYFLVHFAFMLINIYMVATRQVKLRFKDTIIAFVVLSIFAAFNAIINKALGTNYMYLRELPGPLAGLCGTIGKWYLALFGIFIFGTFQAGYWLVQLIYHSYDKMKQKRECVDA